MVVNNDESDCSMVTLGVVGYFGLSWQQLDAI